MADPNEHHYTLGGDNLADSIHRVPMKKIRARANLNAHEFIRCPHCRHEGIRPIDAVPAMIPSFGIAHFTCSPDHVFKATQIVVEGDVVGRLRVLDVRVGVIGHLYDDPNDMKAGISVENLPVEMHGIATCQISQRMTVVIRNVTDHPVTCSVHLKGLSIDIDGGDDEVLVTCS